MYNEDDFWDLIGDTSRMDFLQMDKLKNIDCFLMKYIKYLFEHLHGSGMAYKIKNVGSFL